MTECPLCHDTAGFRVKLVDGVAMHKCNSCSASVPVVDVEDEASAGVRAAPPATVRPGTRPAPAPAKPDAPVNVVKLARARLRVVEREIKARQKLETERDQLRRLLAAAQGPKAARGEGARSVEPRARN